MKLNRLLVTTGAGALGLIAPNFAQAADVVVIANSGAAAVASNMAANTAGHTWDSFDADMTPTQQFLQNYDVVLLFENGLFPNAPNVGNALETYFNGGGSVIAATFYLQDRSDNPNYPTNYGWGGLENIDVFNASSGGCEYNADSMDPNSIVNHPLTAGVSTLFGNSYRGGATAKANTNVVALWNTNNQDNQPDPVIGYRQDGSSCFVGIGIFPDYPNFGTINVDFGGDFYQMFENAAGWAGSCAGFCGDGNPDPNEECDDGNMNNTDDCIEGCVSATCGDGYVWDGNEDCDDGNMVNTDDCVEGCVSASCGDGYLWDGNEDCDDGNMDDTDDCVAGCVPASCGDGFVWDGNEECDDGNAENTDDCVEGCLAATCGDGYVQDGVEGCDDGNQVDDDECTNSCALASCGDGMVQQGEDCDDGNAENTDDCLDTCVTANCGDGFVRDGVEECDDGNDIDGDGCDSDCTVSASDTGTGTATDTTTGDDGTGTSGGDASASATGTGGTTGGTTGEPTSGTTFGGDGGRGSDDGCGCSAAPPRFTWFAIAALGLLGLRRRRS